MGKDLRNVVMFPEYIIEFQKELCQHPDVQACMIGSDSFETNLSRICTHLNILVDGVYDVEPLVNMLIKKLREKRTINIYSEIPK